MASVNPIVEVSANTIGYVLELAPAEARDLLAVINGHGHVKLAYARGENPSVYHIAEVLSESLGESRDACYKTG